MWVFLTRRLRMWLLFTVVIPLVRRLWGRAKANRMARRAQPAPPLPVDATAGDQHTL